MTDPLPPISTGPSLTDTPRRPVWQRRWFQWLIGLLVGLLVLSFILPPIFAVIYEIRSILVPVLIALGLAYVVNPAITYVNRHYRIPRWAATAGILAMGVFILSIFLLLALPPVIQQGSDLIDKLRTTYPQRVMKWLEEAETAASGEAVPIEGVDASTLPSPAESNGSETPVEAETPGRDTDGPVAHTIEEPADVNASDEEWSLFGGLLDRARDPAQWRSLLATINERLRNLEWSQVSNVLATSLDVGVGVVGTAIGLTTYIGLAILIVVICFFYFAWKFDHISGWFVDFIPASHRAETLTLIEKMDHSISRFIRGRLIQAAVMGATLSIGWWIVGVPYWLLLGLMSGLMNLVPFVAVVGWILATLLTVIDHTSGSHGFTIWTLLGPTLVYMIAQGVDGWVVEPVVQGQATNLDPITVMLVVMVGAAVAGLLGMLLAIPTAACVKILAKEVVLPKVRALAAQN